MDYEDLSTADLHILDAQALDNLAKTQLNMEVRAQWQATRLEVSRVLEARRAEATPEPESALDETEQQLQAKAEGLAPDSPQALMAQRFKDVRVAIQQEEAVARVRVAEAEAALAKREG